MKNLKNAVSLVVGCILLSALVSLDAIAQTKSKGNRKPLAKIVNCKDNDSDCFIRAAKTCRKATVTMNIMNPDVPSPTYTQTLRYEIRDRQNGKCAFYSKIEKADVKYSEDYIRNVMKNEGKTRQQVEQIMSDERESYRQTAGRDGVCFFQTKKLVEILNGWWQKDGGVRFSTKDFEGADCQGTLYNFTLPNQMVKQ